MAPVDVDEEADAAGVPAELIPDWLMHTLLVDVDVDDELLIATGDDEALVPDDVPVCRGRTARFLLAGGIR